MSLWRPQCDVCGRFVGLDGYIEAPCEDGWYGGLEGGEVRCRLHLRSRDVPPGWTGWKQRKITKSDFAEGATT